jgi:hypothetical protein
MEPATSTSPIVLLSHHLLCAEAPQPVSGSDFQNCLGLAHRHHVIVRWLERLLATPETSSAATVEGAAAALAEEKARINNALVFLAAICEEFDRQGCDVTVIKSLDHWPDLGSDLDLYSNGPAEKVIRIMQDRFQATVAERSWGDRLAGKWNFIIPGLPEAVEVHVGRMGQTGEHVAWASSIPARSVLVEREQHVFRVASPEDRLMISTLQRMYRHFYFRLCDIVDSSQLVEAGAVDYGRLSSLSASAGIWKGVATYLAIVSDYVKCYRGEGLPLPAAVWNASAFGGEQLSFNRGFLRIPIVPQSVSLYTAELTTLVLQGDLRQTFRLSLLPYLAAAAAVGQKLTGSDKGIW